jgi:hypothetical protein
MAIHVRPEGSGGDETAASSATSARTAPSGPSPATSSVSPSGSRVSVLKEPGAGRSSIKSGAVL